MSNALTYWTSFVVQCVRTNECLVKDWKLRIRLWWCQLCHRWSHGGCRNGHRLRPTWHRDTPWFFMMTPSNGNIFRVTNPLCWEFTGYRWYPPTKASDAELWCFFYLHLNKRLSKQSWDWWFETPSFSLWRHCNVWSICAESYIYIYIHIYDYISDRSTRGISQNTDLLWIH